MRGHLQQCECSLVVAVLPHDRRHAEWLCGSDAGGAAGCESTRNDFNARYCCAGYAMRCSRALACLLRIFKFDVAVAAAAAEVGFKAPSHKGSAHAREGVNGSENAWATYYGICDAHRRLARVFLGVQACCPLRRDARRHHRRPDHGSGVLRSSIKALRRML